MNMKPTNTVFLPDGNNGHLVGLNVQPLAFDGHLVKTTGHRIEVMSQRLKLL